MLRFLTVVFVALSLSACAFAAPAGGGWDGKVPTGCTWLLPKGGGTVVHGTFVKLNQGEALLLCVRAK